MNNEFKKITQDNVTRYVLENASSGGTSSGSVDSVSVPIGSTRKRGDNILAQEADKETVPASTPRNFVAKNAKTGGAGAHKDKKKAEKQGDVKHRKPFAEQGVAEGFNGEYDDEAGMAQSNLLTTARAVMGLLKTIKDRDNLPEWGQEKIAKAEMMLVSVWDYLQSQKAMGNDPQQGVAEGSEWETRHDEFTTVGDRATPEQINKIVKALIGAAQQAGSKRGFLNQLVGKQSNGDLARMAHVAETLAKNIQKNSNAKPGSDERKELGQHLVYAVSLLKRISGEQGVAEGDSDAKYKIVCKDCGDVFNKPTTDCRHDSHNPNGPNWINPERGPSMGGKFTKESSDPYLESLQTMMERQLEPTMDLDAWVDNFQNADPQKYHQFKNKTPEKKK